MNDGIADGIAVLSDMDYYISMSTMQAVTIKLPKETLRRLRREARETGRTVAALVRERVEPASVESSRSVFAATSDLAGSLTGGRSSATNARRRFRRS